MTVCELVPAIVEGESIPARFVGTAAIGRRPNGLLFVGHFTLYEGLEFSEFTAVIIDGGSFHYFHFIESLIWLFSLQNHFLGGRPIRRIVYAYPWDTANHNHIQRQILGAIYPGVEILDGDFRWPARFANVLVIDRAWAKLRINKYLEAAFSFANPYVLRLGYCARAAAGCAERPSHDGLHILYTRRTGKRCLSAPAEAQLIALLRRVGTLSICDFSGMTWAQQVRLVAAHNVIIGVHGAGLTNALWMHPGGLVMEFFPAGTRHYDYQVYSELNDLCYTGFDGDLVFTAFDHSNKPYGHGDPLQKDVEMLSIPTIAQVLQVYAALHGNSDVVRAHMFNAALADAAVTMPNLCRS